MKLHLGIVNRVDKTKSADIITESLLPEVLGIVAAVFTTLTARYIYKKGNEDAMDAENRALDKCGVMDYDPKKDRFTAKVLK